MVFVPWGQTIVSLTLRSLLEGPTEIVVQKKHLAMSDSF